MNAATGFATGSVDMPVQVEAMPMVVRYCELVHHNTGHSWATLDGRRATSSQGGGTGSNPVGAAKDKLGKRHSAECFFSFSGPVATAEFIENVYTLWPTGHSV